MSLYKRKYKNYAHYLTHQSRKLPKRLSDWGRKTREKRFKANVRSFRLRFKQFIKFFRGKDVLCLGARLGEEVVALRKMGYPAAIGIDLNPGSDNLWVLKGDFHSMQFDDRSFDTIYTNCIDHAWNINSLFREINRVLRDDGVVVLEIPHLLRTKKQLKVKLVSKNSKYESVLFDGVADIKRRAAGFRLIKKFPSKYRRIIAVFAKIKTQKNESE